MTKEHSSNTIASFDNASTLIINSLYTWLKEICLKWNLDYTIISSKGARTRFEIVHWLLHQFVRNLFSPCIWSYVIPFDNENLRRIHRHKIQLCYLFIFPLHILVRSNGVGWDIIWHLLNMNLGFLDKPHWRNLMHNID